MGTEQENKPNNGYVTYPAVASGVIRKRMKAVFAAMLPEEELNRVLDQTIKFLLERPKSGKLSEFEKIVEEQVKERFTYYSQLAIEHLFDNNYDKFFGRNFERTVLRMIRPPSFAKRRRKKKALPAKRKIRNRL